MAKVKNKAQAMKAFEDGIFDLADTEAYIRILVYGRNGTEKTRFAASAPKVIILDINEKGTKSARKIPGKGREIKQWQDLTYAYWYLREGNHKFKSVALDTVTMMQKMCMRHVLKEAEDRDPNREPNMPDRRAWGKVAELMGPLLLDFRNLPMNVIFVCQERAIGDPDEDEIIEHVPDLSPGSRGVAMSCVDIIGRTYKKPVKVVNKKAKKEEVVWEPRMLIGPHEEYVTKDQLGLGKRILRRPAMQDFIQATKE